MSELISEKEAFNAWIDGIAVEIFDESNCWHSLHRDHGLCVFDSGGRVKFRLKPSTIKLNGIEVPAPFTAPENLDNSLMWYVLDTDQDRGYSQCRNPKHPSNLLGSWIHEGEIKQVVAALRQVFRG